MISTPSVRRARPVALVTGLLTVLALVLGTASPASASINLSAPSVGPDYDNEAVTAWGAPPAMWSTATHVGLTVCNVASPPYGGRCDQASEPVGGIVSVAAYSSGVTINVRKGPWTDYTYLGGYPATAVSPASSTTCKDSLGAGDQCAVIVSYYRITGMGVTRLGAELQNITFN